MGDTDSVVTPASRKDLNQTEIWYRQAEFGKLPLNCTHYFKKPCQIKLSSYLISYYV